MKKISFLLLLAMLLYFPANAQQFKLPAYEKFVLKNGLTVYLMEQHETPLIYVSMAFNAGSVKDQGKPGLAMITADALLFGTKKYTKGKIEEMTDFVGASIGTGAGKETAQLTASFAVKDQDLMFGLIQEVVMNPVFDETEFKKHKERVLVEKSQEKESPRSVMGSYFNAFLFAGHPYASAVGGSKGSIEALTIEDVKKFYQKEYVNANSAISIVGDFSAKEMKQKITSILEGWNTQAAVKEELTTPQLNFDKSRVLLVNKEDARETTFWIGGKGIPQNNADAVAIQVVNTILGGRFTSWLNDALRVNSGLTYGASSRFNSFKNAGTFYITTFTKTSTTVQAIDMALQVLDSLHKNGVNEEILSSAKNYIKGGFPPRYETARSLANLLTDMFVYGFDENYINNFQKNVDELTVEKAKMIIGKYFPKDNLQFLLIGKKADILDQIKKYGEVKELEIKADGF